MGVKSAEYLLADSMLDVVKNPEGNMPFKSMTKKEHEDEMRDKMKDMDPMQMLQRQTLSGVMLKKMWLDKWDGHLPKVMAGQSSGLILDLKSMGNDEVPAQQEQ